ncbi:MAG: DUF72 domain-containing protein [Candidatus Methanofastidiosia archaeon]
MRIGCCGFPVSQKRYFLEFDLVEIQSTFYKMPERKTVERWRRLPGEFILKCFQGITHSPQSPTWKKSGLEKNKDYGFLQPTEKNFKLWERMEEFSRILRSNLILIQMPPSFSCNSQNVKNLEEFFSSINFQVALELRGDWRENFEVVRRICGSLNLIHVTDILKREPLSKKEILYTRLHGLFGEFNYKYRYTDSDLMELKKRLSKFKERKRYVLFNNIYMWDDSKRFKDLLKGNQSIYKS